MNQPQGPLESGYQIARSLGLKEVIHVDGAYYVPKDVHKTLEELQRKLEIVTKALAAHAGGNLKVFDYLREKLAEADISRIEDRAIIDMQRAKINELEEMQVNQVARDMLRYKAVLEEIRDYVDNDPAHAHAADCAMLARQALNQNPVDTDQFVVDKPIDDHSGKGTKLAQNSLPANGQNDNVLVTNPTEKEQ